MAICVYGCILNNTPVKSDPAFEILDPEAINIFGTNAKLEVIDSGFVWTEGPLWLEKTKELIFNDIPASLDVLLELLSVLLVFVSLSLVLLAISLELLSSTLILLSVSLEFKSVSLDLLSVPLVLLSASLALLSERIPRIL